jgi:diguanylate cyclase
MPSPGRAQSAPCPSAPAELDGALEALANVLRSLGRHALDLADTPNLRIVQMMEDWAQHVLIARPKPGDNGKGRAGRDFPAVAAFAEAFRKREHEAVTAALSDLRETVWAFIHSLNSALADESASDARVSSQLSRLKTAAESGTTQELRDAAVSAATSIAQLVDARRAQQAQRHVDLGKKLAVLGRQLDDARRQSALDPLTQLYNRGALDDHLTRLVSLRSFVERSSSLLLVDVDHFKRVNDSLGHPVGDQVLCKLSECLVRTFLGKQDFVARYGGEEFAVVLPETVPKEALALSERLCAAVRKLDFPQAPTLRITVSVGAAVLEAGEDAAGWVARCDRALYDAKRAGRDRCVLAQV